MKKSLRSFFAIELDENSRNDVNKIITHLRKQRGANKVKWVLPHKLHMTVRFLGEVEAEKIEFCAQQVTKNIEKIHTLQIDYTEVFTFPLRHPHVIALRAHLSQELAELLYAVESAVVSCGFAQETRPLLPHLTLGRLRTNFKPILEDLPIPLPLSHPVTHITLFRSDFVENQTVYTVIKQINLVPSPGAKARGEGAPY